MDVRTLMNYLGFVAPILHRLGKVGETSIADQMRIRLITNEHLALGRLADGLGYLHHEIAPGGIRKLPTEIRQNLKDSETKDLSRYSLALVPFWTRPDQVEVGLMLWKKPDVIQNGLPGNHLVLPTDGSSAPPLGLHLDRTPPGYTLNHSVDNETQYMTTSSIRCNWANDLTRWSLSDKDLSRLWSGGFKLYPLEGGGGPHPQGLLSDEGIRLALAAEAMGLHYLRTDLIPPTQGDRDYFSSVRDAVALLRQDGSWGKSFAYPVLAICLGVSMSSHFRDDPEHEAGIRPRMKWSGFGISDKLAKDFLATQYQKIFDTTRIEETLRQLIVPTLPNRKEMIDHLRKRLERLLQACFAIEQTLPETVRAILPNYETTRRRINALQLANPLEEVSEAASQAPRLVTAATEVTTKDHSPIVLTLGRPVLATPPVIASIFPREVTVLGEILRLSPNDSATWYDSEEACPCEVRLREKQWVQGYWIAALTPLEFYPNGQIRSGYLAGPVTISGIPLEYGDYFLVNPEGELLSFRPFTPRTLFGQDIAARQLVHFETSAGTLQIKGKIPA